MLRISPSEANADQVKKYFIHHHAQEAYYSEGQDFNGIWGGKGAARLGLAGSLQEGAFSRLCDNLHPLTGEQLTPRMREDRRIGYDVNFHVPKSVSLAYFYSRDERILQIIRQAVSETMSDMEKDAAVRVRKDGQDYDRATGEIAYAEFVHLTARPVGQVPDPLVHVHCYVFNATFDQKEEQWKALQFGWVKEEADHYQKAFHARLSTGLKELGLAIENNDFAFEVGGVTRQLIKKFSRRTDVIHAEAARRGLTDAAEIDKLGALTRERKVQDVPISELEPIWWARLSPEEKQVLEAIKATLEQSRAKESARDMAVASAALGTQPEAARGRLVIDDKGRPVSMNRATWPVEKQEAAFVEPSKDDLKAVRFAVEHIFERMSVVTEKQLIAEAFRSWSYGKATLEGVREAVRSWPLLRVREGHRTLITTKEVLAEEKRIAERCKTGQGQYSYINPSWQIESDHLNAQQREAVYHVLRSPDFITGISGKAGTGKTTLLHEASSAIRAGGKCLWVFAPTAEAARDTLRKEGFKEAETVARLLNSEALQKEAAGGVWWVDEAGLMSARSMDRFLELAERRNARVVLVGDTGQHHAVERGQAFDHLCKQGGMRVAEVGQIQRQRGEYKQAVELISERKFEAGFAVLEKMGAFNEIELQAEREQALAKGYAEALAAGESALTVAPTHKEGRSVTQAIRRELKEQNQLGEGQKWHVLRNLSWTTAKKRDARSYEPGLVAEVNRPTEGFAIGERLEVIKAGDTAVKVRGIGGEVRDLPLSHPESFNVFERDAIELCTGDKIRVTANGRSAERHRLYNRSSYTVQGFTTTGEIVLNNGWRLGKDFAHLDYGYVTTSHVAQSKTVDWIFVAQSAEQSAGATDANQFYVSVSRGRKGVKIYTDSLEQLRENVSRVRERPMAMEVMEQEEREKSAGERRVAETSATLGSEEAVINGKEAEQLLTSVEREQEGAPKTVEVLCVQPEERSAELLGTQKEIECQPAEAVERMARERGREEEQELVMGM